MVLFIDFIKITGGCCSKNFVHTDIETISYLFCINLSSECSPLEKSLKGNGTLILDLYNFRYVPLDKG